MPATYTEPRSDAYTGLLAISLGAMVISAIILWLDFGQYPSKPATPTPPKLRAQPQEPPVEKPGDKGNEKPADGKTDKQ